ncbi:MAG: PTS sugar transporter subunit IIA [Thermoanaerobaculales bacterium]|nr:PTS sugar transporter subunit IIA [Thermoanaerobaculales bacterium]
MHLYSQLTPERVLIAPSVIDRKGLFHLFGEVFQRTGKVGDPDEVSRLLCEREKILSTAIGGGWAIPHAQMSGIGGLMMAVSVHPEGIEYASLDELPVRLVFCLLGDSNTAADHLAGLARLARLARHAEVLERLTQTRSAEDFLSTLRKIEEA